MSCFGKQGEDACLRAFLLDNSSPERTPRGFFTVYVGGERVRFAVPMSFLNHPLFKMLLEKSHDEYVDFSESVKLVLPCNVTAFQKVINAIECSMGRFEFGDLVQEFI